ncbi:hypothetical protein ThrDRAFT_03393 [Frankia casuarinae]|uniref:Uncharacterized protein n=1 Tax=Frankia casuarinae (strain DSM 45818 / CECT 9043 / HFP020203 / CcI3) TaxID=106370 RepID=Q2J9V6_FRACC|nr:MULTISPECIES: hypothetical protein [Frankia]ABD11936.1 hypothetical protein Francci3_2574 [Frankia casuarinae]EYT90989.1 hypothetical protein ThrDRAFT_03393 [Frankia casuarinae]KDA41542.1 hypothetical protein BMG523Draft_03610 [Frankia sp. BMG5.23]ORT48842.1 hypothetical protein KBI5_15200 [Frankia sp. KB5]TFE25503.1 hypothetical protein E0F15_19750 [Frankia sp. B2]
MARWNRRRRDDGGGAAPPGTGRPAAGTGGPAQPVAGALPADVAGLMARLGRYEFAPAASDEPDVWGDLQRPFLASATADAAGFAAALAREVGPAGGWALVGAESLLRNFADGATRRAIPTYVELLDASIDFLRASRVPFGRLIGFYTERWAERGGTEVDWLPGSGHDGPFPGAGPGGTPAGSPDWSQVSVVRAEWPLDRAGIEADVAAWEHGVQLYDAHDDYATMMRAGMMLARLLRHHLHGRAVLDDPVLAVTTHHVLFAARTPPPDGVTVAQHALRMARLGLTVMRAHGWQSAEFGGDGTLAEPFFTGGNRLLLTAALASGGRPGESELRRFFGADGTLDRA